MEEQPDNPSARIERLRSELRARIRELRRQVAETDEEIEKATDRAPAPASGPGSEGPHAQRPAADDEAAG